VVKQGGRFFQTTRGKSVNTCSELLCILRNSPKDIKHVTSVVALGGPYFKNILILI
jgi:hypothetical protein